MSPRIQTRARLGKAVAALTAVAVAVAAGAMSILVEAM